MSKNETKTGTSFNPVTGQSVPKATVSNDKGDKASAVGSTSKEAQQKAESKLSKKESK